MSNHTDFDALRAHPEVDLRFVRAGEAIPAADLVILPGSKNTRGDLAWLRSEGWPAQLARHLRYGGKVIGICGGFQMLGRCVADPHGVEGSAGTSEGLGLLGIETELAREKRLALISGQASLGGGAPFALRGYEIHMGVSTGAAMDRPAFVIDGRSEGACSADDQVLGTYLHGVFDHPEAGAALLAWAGLQSQLVVDTTALREASIDRIADATAPVLDRLLSLMRAGSA
jgi:adenosylcobyric acid synthase